MLRRKDLVRMMVLAAVWAASGVPGTAQVRREAVEAIIRDCETRTDAFVRAFDRALDRSGLNGTNREDELNQSARRLEWAMDELRSEFNRQRDWLDAKDAARKALDAGRDINGTMRNRRIAGVEREWAAIRSELNRLAKVFNLPGIVPGNRR